MGHKLAAALISVAAMAAALAAGAAPATVVDGRVGIDSTGAPPRAGQDFVVVASVGSEGERAPFGFTVRLTFAAGLEVVGWRSEFMAVTCDRAGQTLTCRDRVIGDIVSWSLRVTLRAAGAGSYAVSADLTVEDASDTNQANNTAQHVSEVLPAAVARPRGRGTARADTITGTGGDDRLFGLGGADTMRGLAGHDLLDGGAGNDKLFGGAGNDRLVGGAGVNAYSGGAGNDTVRARNGRAERISCGAGNDSAVLDRSDRQSGCERVTRR